MTWRAPTPKFPRVRCPACAREPFLIDERYAADYVRVLYACQCGHRFPHRHPVQRLHRQIVEAAR